MMLKPTKRLCSNLLFPFASSAVAIFSWPSSISSRIFVEFSHFCWPTPLPPLCVALPRSVKLCLLHLSQPVYLAQVSAIFKEFPNLCADLFRCCLRLLTHREWDGVSLVLLTVQDKEMRVCKAHFFVSNSELSNESFHQAPK